MNKANPFALDRSQLRLSFERAAQTYDTAAGLQHEIADRLLERLEIVRLTPQHILDVGCGTGYCSDLLGRRYRGACVFGVDLAQAMLRRARHRAWWRPTAWKRRVVCGDAQQLPVASASVDLIVSNLMLQWCQPLVVFAEFRRVLRPGGLFMFTTFGPDTLKEIRAAWSAVDDGPHVHSFLDLRDVGDLLLQSDFTDPVVDVERLTLHAASVTEVLRDLKRIGAHNMAQHRARGLTGKQRFNQFRRAYEAMAAERGIPVTYEIVFGHALVTGADGPRARDRGDVSIPLSAIKRRHD